MRFELRREIVLVPDVGRCVEFYTSVPGLQVRGNSKDLERVEPDAWGRTSAPAKLDQLRPRFELRQLERYWHRSGVSLQCGGSRFPGNRKTAQADLAERARCMASVALLTCIFFIRCQRWIDTVFIEMLSF